MLFVTKVVQTGPKSSIESNVRMGGYKQEKTARNAAKRHRPAIIRNHNREIVGQTVNRDLPNYIS
jgi:hypothetical protein